MKVTIACDEVGSEGHNLLINGMREFAEAPGAVLTSDLS